MVRPPVFIMPFMVIIAEGGVFFARPVFAPLDVTGSFKLHARDCRIGLAWQIEVLRTKRIRLCLIGSRTDGAVCYTMLYLLDRARPAARCRRLRRNHPCWSFHSARLFP